MPRLGIYTLALAVVVCRGVACATIIQVTGPVVEIAPPPSVVFNELESNEDIFVFSERVDHILSSDVTVDISAPGYVASNASLTPATILSGRQVNSYFVHFDPVGTANTFVFNGSITFSEPILGLAVISESLSQSDAILGAPGTDYPTPQLARGLELGASEQIELSSDFRTVHIHQFRATFPGEQMRIITVPEPATVTLAIAAVLLGLLALAIRVARRA